MALKPDSVRIGEITEASTTEFTAQCYELYQSPPLGGLVKTQDLPAKLYGIVYNVSTTSLEPGRRPIARGKDETDEAAIYRSSPQLSRLLRTEFNALVVGYRENDRLHHYLPPNPPRIHSFAYSCPLDEVKEFSQSFDFLNILLSAHLPVPTEELISASLRQMSQAYEEPRIFLVTAGKELATLLGSEFSRLRAILGRIRE